MYAGGSEHPLREPSRVLLREAAAERLDAVISAEVVQEIFHRFLAIGRARTGVEMASATLDLFAPVIPVTHSLMLRMPRLVEKYPDLAARDLVHVATCAEEGIGTIISPDRAFDRVEGLQRIAPDDLQGVAALLS